MASERNYRVLPKRVRPPAVRVSFVDLVGKRGVFTALYYGGGCLTMILLFLGVFIVLQEYFPNLLNNRGPAGALVFPSAVIFSVGLVFLTHLVLGKVRIPSAEKRKSAEAYEEAARRLSEEAASLTSRLTQTYESSAGLRGRLSEQLDGISRRLERAEAEYEENAAHPFWDQVGEAARSIDSYGRTLDELARNAAYYYEQLSGREHDFPPFPVKLGEVPSASPVLTEFERVARLGLADRHFTATLDRRRTAKGWIRDYPSLRELMEKLPASISNSLSRLHQAVSSDAARRVEDGGAGRRA